MDFEKKWQQKSETLEKNINNLSEHLSVLYGDLSESRRFEEWIKYLNNNNKLRLFTDSPSAFKTPYYTKDWSDIVIKKFDKINNRVAYEAEKNHFGIVRQYLGDRYLPRTEYVEMDDGNDEDDKYYAIQDKIQGRYQQDAADEAIKEIHDSMTEKEINETYVGNPDNWVKFRGEIFKKGMNLEQWDSAKLEAIELVNRLKKLEEKYIINDLDYFVTPEGSIKIIDFQLHDKDDKSINNDFPIGSKEIRLFFGV